VHELLDLVQDRLALLAIHLGRLLAKEPVDVRVAAVRVQALGEYSRLDPRRGVTARRVGAEDEVLELLFLERLVESHPLHGAHGEVNPDGLQVIGHCLGDRRVHDVGVDLTRVEPARVTGLG